MVEFVSCNKILENLQSPGMRSFRGLEKPLTELEMVVKKIKERLPDAKKKQKDDHVVSSWLEKVCAALDEVDDLVDKLTYVGYHKRAMAADGIKKQVRLFFSPFNDIAFGPKRAKLVQKVKGTLESLIRESDAFGFSIRPIADEGRLWDNHVSMVLDQTPIGRDEDKQALVDMLLDSSAGPDIECVAITGIGGIGKTTLARWIYNDAMVKTHFELRMWVSVGQVFNIEDIASKIIRCAAIETPPLDLQTLGSQLGKAINGKFYLLVLDDVWYHHPEQWLKLRCLLNGGVRGSKILVTTRSTGPRSHLDKIYAMPGLSDEDSWTLFQQLTCQQTIYGSEFTYIGREIVRKCGGVPLPIRLLGSLLRGQGIQNWLSVLNQINENTVIMYHYPLSLAYDHLPANLKACFAFCSIFPKNYEWKKCDLISLWMAQGFIKPQLNQSLRDVGEEYFQALHRRSFFNNVKEDELGNISTCEMHDLVHDLALFVAPQFYSGTISPKMRTFLQLEKHAADFEIKPAKLICDELVPNLRCLRALVLQDCGIQELPKSIAKLLLLRYLDLSNNDCLVEIAQFITRLYHLQTLKLNSCEKLKRLPKGIGKLVNLMRLEIDECDSLTALPLGLERLTCLETLSRFIVGKDGSDPKRYCGLRVLSGLNKLEGRLTIELSGEHSDVLEEAAATNLSDKSKLSELRIGWGLKRPDQVNPSQFHALLAGINSLARLTVLDIDGCKECQDLPEFSQLHSLKCLTLRHMDGVEYMESSKQPPSPFFFRSLEELTLHSFYNLKRWWKPVREGQLEQQEGKVEQQPSPSFSCLLKLKIWNCPKLIDLPLFSHVEDLDLLNVNQRLLQDSGASSATMNATSSAATCSSSIVNRFRNLPHLKRLQIKNCPSLKSLPSLGESMESSGVSSLKYLVVDSCNKLRSLAEGLQHFSSLQELVISRCEELDFSVENQDDGMPWRSLSVLRYLTFNDIPHMQNLPNGLKYVSTLRLLCISSCNNLACLPEWMGSLTSLVHLRMECCSTLAKLPNSLRDLHSLVKVEITECPKLVERCREHTGEDWHKIKHARVLLHKSWRYGLLSDEGNSQQNHGRAAHSKDGVIHVAGATVTKTSNANDSQRNGN